MNKSKIVGGIEIKVGDKLEMFGRTFVLYIDYSLGGDFVVWADENSPMRVYASPNFEIKGVPIQIDYESFNVGLGCYEGKINDYEHYKQIVKEEFEKLMKSLPNSTKCGCYKYIERKQIKIEGWNFSICTYCGKVVDENQQNLSKI